MRDSTQPGRAFAYYHPIFGWMGGVSISEPWSWLGSCAGRLLKCSSLIQERDTQHLPLIGHGGQDRQASAGILRSRRSGADRSRAGKTVRHDGEQQVFQTERIAHRKAWKREYVKEHPQWPWS